MIPKRLVKLAKDLAYRRYIHRAVEATGDRIATETAYAAKLAKVKHDYYLRQHLRRTERRMVA